MTTQATSIRRRLADNIRRVRDRIEDACAKAARSPSDVTLVAVTKAVDLDIVRLSMEMGLLDLGESRAQQLDQRAAMIQEFLKRRQVLAHDAPALRPRWHMVGHLQTNKIRLVLPWCDLIHSVDSLRLAEELNEQADRAGRDVPMLLQVNTSGERSKFGVVVGAVPYVIEQMMELPRIRLRGLMTMAPLDATPAEVRLYFDRLREVFEELRQNREAGPEFDQLSMGMSNDYTIGIAAGATLVRIGTALFEGIAGVPTAEATDDAP